MARKKPATQGKKLGWAWESVQLENTSVWAESGRPLVRVRCYPPRKSVTEKTMIAMDWSMTIALAKVAFVERPVLQTGVANTAGIATMLVLKAKSVKS